MTVPSIGTIYVTGAEVYGGDIKSTNGTATLDWGTFQLSNSKNALLYLSAGGKLLKTRAQRAEIKEQEECFVCHRLALR